MRQYAQNLHTHPSLSLPLHIAHMRKGDVRIFLKNYSFAASSNLCTLITSTLGGLPVIAVGIQYILLFIGSIYAITHQVFLKTVCAVPHFSVCIFLSLGKMVQLEQRRLSWAYIVITIYIFRWRHCLARLSPYLVATITSNKFGFTSIFLQFTLIVDNTIQQ